MPVVVGQDVGPIGFGLMNFTWRPQQTPDEIAFKSINTSVSLGGNFLNSGAFYGHPDPLMGLKLLNRYYTANPDAAKKTVVSVKGGNKAGELTPSGNLDNQRRSINEILSHLDGKKHLDIYTIARLDKSVPVEEQLKMIDEEFIQTGKISGVCLSEIGAETLKQAVKVVKIAAVELEVSLWATEIFENGVAEVCREHGIPVVAYSPLGRGFLTGQLKSPDDIPEGDFRKYFDRFQPENFNKNLELVSQIQKVADKKGVKAPQLALAWLKAQSKDGLTIIPIFGATKVEQVKENLADIEITKEEEEEINAILKSFKPIGGRYNDQTKHTLEQ